MGEGEVNIKEELKWSHKEITNDKIFFLCKRLKEFRKLIQENKDNYSGNTKNQHQEHIRNLGIKVKILDDILNNDIDNVIAQYDEKINKIKLLKEYKKEIKKEK